MKLADEKQDVLRQRARQAVAPGGGWTRPALAEASGYSVSSLNLFLQARNRISAEGARRLLDAFRKGPPPSDGKPTGKTPPWPVLRQGAKKALAERFDGELGQMARALAMNTMPLKRFLAGGRLPPRYREVLATLQVDLYTPDRVTTLRASVETSAFAAPPAKAASSHQTAARDLFGRWGREAMQHLLQEEDD
jgi:hypothetical protein